MIAIIGVLLIIIGIVIAKNESDAAAFCVIFFVGGIVLFVWGLWPVLSQIN